MKNPRANRRGFSLVEVLIAIAITSTLLTATLVSLDASFRAYQSTTEEVSSNAIGRIVMHRMLTMIRTGTDFGPFPEDPRVKLVQTDFIEFKTQSGEIVTIQWDRNSEELTYQLDGQPSVPLLGGVIGTQDSMGNYVSPFTLEYADGRRLHLATIDFTIEPDDIIDLDIEGDRDSNELRFVGSAMPRLEAF